MAAPIRPKIKRLRPDPYSARRKAYERGEPFDPECGSRLVGSPSISAQCVCEEGRLAAVSGEANSKRVKRKAQDESLAQPGSVPRVSMTG